MGGLMINLDDELAENYLAECREYMVRIEADLLAMQDAAPDAPPDQFLEAADRAYRALHWVQGGASVFELVKIGGLARQMEHLLELIRSRKLPPNQRRIRVLLDGFDRLRELVDDPAASNQTDIAAIMAALIMLEENRAKQSLQDGNPPRGAARRLRILLVEDDFASRLLLQTFLSNYGDCHIAVNGKEAVEIFRYGLERSQRYDLICMDIMMPEMDGREAVGHIRALEEEHGILSSSGAKIIMTTAVDDVKEVIRCFHELCDCYLVKPIDLAKLLDQMRAYHLIE
jgi:two-component system, chemotaxis family, chemotaxis protein CheY